MQKGDNRRCKQGWVMEKGFRNTAWVCRDGAKNDKAHLELTLARAVKGNMKSIYPYISSKRRNKENKDLLPDGEGGLVTAGR